MENHAAPNEQSNPRPDVPEYKALDSGADDEFDLDIRLELPGYTNGSDALRLGFPTNTCITCGDSCPVCHTDAPTCGGSCIPTSCCGTGGGSCNPTSCCTFQSVTCGNCTPGCGHHTDQDTCGGNCG